MASEAVSQWIKALDSRPRHETFDSWLRYVKNLNDFERPSAIRLGQFWYSELHASRPDLAKKVRERPGTDPYDDNRNMQRFLHYLEDSWQAA